MPKPSRKSAANASANLSNNQPIIVAGPTGVGKTLFAVELARQLGGEIVGADAYQVYDGLRILTAQPPLPGQVPHHLIGIVSPAEPFDAATFVAHARPLLAEIQARGHVPILTGGTGLYLKALTHGLADIPPPDPSLRAELSRLSLEELVQSLHAADPDACTRVDLRNPRRVQRALEIVRTTGRPFAKSREGWATRDTPGFRGLLLTRDREELDERIAENVDRMFAEGVVEEVGRLGPVGPTAGRAIGLREIQEFRAGVISEETCRERMILGTRQYARRQLTWFRNQFSFPAIDLTGPIPLAEALPSALQLLGAE